ncbi:AmMst-1 [Meredithblackwellia eburnea MCA 4105]
MGGGPGGSGDGINSSSMTITLLMASFAAIGGACFGYDTGTISGIIAMPDWLRTFGVKDLTGEITTNGGYYLPTNDQSLVVSILSAGTFFGALFSYPFGDLLGRRMGLVASCAVFSLGVGLQLDTRWSVFVAGRFFAGLGVGLISTLVPMYQSECTPQAHRGKVVGLYQFAITIGLLLASIVNNFTKDIASHDSWRIPIAVQFGWAGVLAIGMLFLPESPRYLLLKGRVDDGRRSLARLSRLPMDSPEVQADCDKILAGLALEKEAGQTSYIDCFRNGPGRNAFRTWSGILIQMWAQLTGINFIFYYGTTFFLRSGIKNGFLIGVATNVVNVVMTIPGIFLIDKVGRRPMLIVGAAGMLFCEFIVAIVGVAAGQAKADGSVNLVAQKVLVAFTCIYIAFWASTWGPCVWTTTAEIFPLALRAKGMSLSVASNWLWNFAIGYATPYLINPSSSGVNGIKAANLGVKVFFIWGATCCGCLVFVYLCIPELKGLSLEQVDLLYRESTVLGSNKFRTALLREAENPTALNEVESSEKNVLDGSHLERA